MKTQKGRGKGGSKRGEDRRSLLFFVVFLCFCLFVSVSNIVSTTLIQVKKECESKRLKVRGERKGKGVEEVRVSAGLVGRWQGGRVQPGGRKGRREKEVR